ncbi:MULTISPECIES: hypothetical protein [unclassified Streptomyces]|uniref:hypothetical protein n=1 Tax=unclassified Streptomyces TaxID=2593676 RepID=UPI0021C6FF10|nr:hypothetical protein [Streptomyces sp. me109]
MIVVLHQLKGGPVGAVQALSAIIGPQAQGSVRQGSSVISEPEMAGEFDVVTSREVRGDFDSEPVARRRLSKPWWWALGGVLAASALWAPAVFVYGLGIQKPSTHGYRLDKNPCPSVRLTSISAAVAPRVSSDVVQAGLLKHAAVDQAQCSITVRPLAKTKPLKAGWSLDYYVGITVTLHKETDPEVEFEAQQRMTDQGLVPADNVRTVPDLGDTAYLITRDISNTELRVLDGGAVLSLDLAASSNYQSEDADDEIGEGPEMPDISSYQSAMVNDMRDLMASLKR